MPSLEPSRLREQASQGAAGGNAAAEALLGALNASAGDPETAVRSVLASLLRQMSRNYFAQDWAAEHEYSVWARLVDDPRAWGYGSEEEVAPLRWLVEITGRWFDGTEMLTVEAWQPRFEAWAETQHGMVRQVTPGALKPDERFASHD
ncbi:MAG: hypothetical protein KJ053_06540 [Dehalococcoidia bacterium]|nr:hypothetical protein [Dehalococcoidia bacterium]